MDLKQRTRKKSRSLGLGDSIWQFAEIVSTLSVRSGQGGARAKSLGRLSQELHLNPLPAGLTHERKLVHTINL